MDYTVLVSSTFTECVLIADRVVDSGTHITEELYGEYA